MSRFPALGNGGSMPARFSFSKAYLDAIDPEGGWWIGYDAGLSWGPLRVGYREISGPGLRRASTTLLPRQVVTGAVDLASKGQLRLEGGEVGSDVSLKTPLLEWRLTHRGADVIVDTGQGARRIASAGYGEVVTLHRPPWELGVRALHWGRYMSEQHFVTWIVATGEHAIAFGVVGDETSQTAAVEGNRINVGSAELSLDSVVATISGGDAIGERAWPARALVETLAPKFSVIQHKAVYRSSLRLGSGAVENGLAIAEQVRFSGR